MNLKRLRLKWTDLFHRRRLRQELDEEIRAHIEIDIRERIDRGDSPGAARTNALREFGSIGGIKEDTRAMWAWTWLESLMQDMCFGMRMLWRNPGFTTTAILTLALGVGANTAVFSVIRSVLLEPLPYLQADRIVQLESRWDDFAVGPNISIPKFVTLRAHTDIFQDATLYWAYGGRVNLTGGDRPEQIADMHVSAEYFRLFGANTALGRTFTTEEDKPNGPHVAVISDGLWRRRFGSDPQLIGKTIEIGGIPHVLSGVLSAGFRWDPPVDVWLPLQADLNSTGPTHEYYAAARLKTGVSTEQANAAANVAFDEFRRKFSGPLAFPGKGFVVERVQDLVVKDVRPSLRLLLGATGFVLLIACTNVASLLLAKGSARQHEIAIRAALSAGRARIIRQLLTESVLLSSAGAALGLVLGYAGVHALFLISPSDIPRIGEHGSGLTMDWHLIAFVMSVAVFTTGLYALIPAIQVSRVDLNADLKLNASRAGIGMRHTRLRSFLVIMEIAIALVLLVGSTLLIRTYIAQHSVRPGFDGHNVITLDMMLDGPRFEKASEITRVALNGSERLERIAGIKAAATTWSLPLEPPNDPQAITIVGRPLGDQTYHGNCDWRLVTPHYFDVFRIPVVRGRSFTDHDDASGMPVVIINQAMARMFWPDGSDPVGQQIWVNKGMGKGFEEPRPRIVIGIARDVKDGGLDAPTPAIMYVPVSQVQDNVLPFYSQAFRLMWVIRTKAEPFSLVPDIQRELRGASGGLPVGQVRSMDEVKSESTARSDFIVSLFTIFAALAVLMAAVGIYGVMAYTVEQRRREIGVRIALGASPSAVRRMIFKHGALLTIVGTAIGISGAIALTRLLAQFLFGVTAHDPAAFLSAIVLLGVIALLAACIPAYRAMNVDPIVALHYE